MRILYHSQQVSNCIPKCPQNSTAMPRGQCVGKAQIEEALNIFSQNNYRFTSSFVWVSYKSLFNQSCLVILFFFLKKKGFWKPLLGGFRLKEIHEERESLRNKLWQQFRGWNDLKMVCLRVTNKEFANIDKGREEQATVFSKRCNKYLACIVIGRR